MIVILDPRSLTGVVLVPIHRLPPVNRAYARANLPVPVLALLAQFVGSSFRASHVSLFEPRICFARLPSLATGWHCMHQGLIRGQNEVAAYELNKVRRLVCVVNLELGYNCNAVASSIEMQSKFSKGCWLAARTFHRCRRLGQSSEYAEVLGSFLTSLWDPVQGLDTGGIIQRLMLKASGFQGDGTDDFFVSKVAAAIKLKPCLKPKALRKAKLKYKLSAHGLSIRIMRGKKRVAKNQSLFQRREAVAAVACSELPQRTLTGWCLFSKQHRLR